MKRRSVLLPATLIAGVLPGSALAYDQCPDGGVRAAPGSPRPANRRPLPPASMPPWSSTLNAPAQRGVAGEVAAVPPVAASSALPSGEPQAPPERRASAPDPSAVCDPQPPAAPALPGVAPSPPPADPEGRQEVLRVDGLILYAREIDQRPAENLIVLTGEPEAVAGTDRLTADRITIEQTTQVITAEGNVVIRRPTGTIYATKAVYDYGAGTGTATSGNTIFGNYRIHAEEIRLLPGPAYHALRARLTTCFEEKPHYEIYTRELELYPGDKLIARHIGIDLLNRRLITVPRYTKSLKEGSGEEEEKSLYPSFGYASRLGFYASKDFTLRRSAPAWVDGYVQINTFHEPTIGLQAATPGRLQWVGALFYRDIAENQRVPLLQVTRLPEVGLVWSPRRGVPRPGQFLAHQVSNVRAPRQLDWIGRDWIPSAQVSLGFFRQHHGQETIGPQSQSKNGFRGVLQAQAVKPVVKLGPFTLNDLRLLARGSVYDNGDRLGVLGTGIGKRYKLGRWELKLRRFDQWTSGRTPFLFDDVELRQEWRPQVEYHSRTFNFSYTVRLRNGGGVFDQIFSVSKLFHCIEPQITYRTRRNLFMLEVRIPGFSGFGRSRADEPGALDAGQAGRAASPVPPPVERP